MVYTQPFCCYKHHTCFKPLIFVKEDFSHASAILVSLVSGWICLISVFSPLISLQYCTFRFSWKRWKTCFCYDQTFSYLFEIDVERVCKHSVHSWSFVSTQRGHFYLVFTMLHLHTISSMLCVAHIVQYHPEHRFSVTVAQLFYLSSSV